MAHACLIDLFALQHINTSTTAIAIAITACSSHYIDIDQCKRCDVKFAIKFQPANMLMDSYTT